MRERPGFGTKGGLVGPWSHTQRATSSREHCSMPPRKQAAKSPTSLYKWKKGNLLRGGEYIWAAKCTSTSNVREERYPSALAPKRAKAGGKTTQKKPMNRSGNGNKLYTLLIWVNKG